MADRVSEHYLENCLNEFTKMKLLAEKAINQIKYEDIFWSPDEESNSIAIIIKHMHGNMISRWTDFLTTDGEKPTRNRDEEFNKVFYTDKDDLLERWEKGWKVVFEVIGSLKDIDLMREITIRGEKHTIIQALNRQLTHYSYHVGQIIYIAKHLNQSSWNSLSIPKGKSEEFNEKMNKKD
jgi:hypothetical protein